MIFFTKNPNLAKKILAGESGGGRGVARVSDFFLNKRAMMALGRSPEYHWNHIISKSVHRFSSRSHLKFLIYSPGGHFVQQSETV